VLNLAQRSAAAAKEIKALIGGSVEQVEAGSQLVSAAGRTMEDIVAAVKKVSDLIGEIASASQEQSSGIEQVNTAVTQMDQVVQQNASLVEEAAAATESMKVQATTLQRMVERFRVHSGTVADAQAVTAAAMLARDQAGPGPIPFKPRVEAKPPVRGVAPASRAPAAEWNTF
jgi:ABC-type transporter Mla subunit MlaD